MTKREQFIADVRSASTEALSERIGVPTLSCAESDVINARYQRLADRAGQDELNEALGRKHISYFYTPSDRVKAEAILILEYNNAHPDEIP